MTSDAQAKAIDRQLERDAADAAIVDDADFDGYYPEVEVQLTGEDGNAFFIISRTMRALRKAGVPRQHVEAFRIEAMSGDYNNVLNTVAKWVTVL